MTTLPKYEKGARNDKDYVERMIETENYENLKKASKATKYAWKKNSDVDKFCNRILEKTQKRFF